MPSTLLAARLSICGTALFGGGAEGAHRCDRFGVVCVAASVFRDDVVIAAVSVTGPKARIDAIVSAAHEKYRRGVLESVYDYSREEIAGAVDTLLRMVCVLTEDSDLVRAALSAYRTGADFADALIAGTNVARGCTKIGRA